MKGALSVAAAGGGLAISSPRRVLGANDRVRVAICGVRGRGFDHVKFAAQIPNVEIAAICDVDENVWRKRLADMEKRNIPKPANYYTDVRKLLEDKSIDAISIATPNHWHSLIGIWACQAGKDVYVEKPCSHNWWEGRQLVRAAQKYNRIVQHGTQSRSAPSAGGHSEDARRADWRRLPGARALLQVARHHRPRARSSRCPPAFTTICGPARRPLQPFTKNRFHYNWHWFWDYGNGDLGNQGIHQMDVARWGLGVKFPNKVSAIGGHFMFDDDQETPNTLNCAFEFDLPDGKRKMMEFEVRHWITNREAEHRQRGNGRRQGRSPTPSATSSMAPRDTLPWAMKTAGMPIKTWLGKEQTPGPSRGQKAATTTPTSSTACAAARRKT